MKKYIPHTIILVLVMALIMQCNKSHNLIKHNANTITALTDSINYFKNRLDGITASKKTLQLTNKQLQDIVFAKDTQLKLLAKEYSKIKSVTTFSNTLKYDSIAIRFEKPIVIQSDSSSTFERSGLITKKWFSLGYKVTNDSLMISPFKTWTQTTIITGIKRKWFLGKETVITDITHTNPHIQVTDITAAEVILPKPWYKKWYVWLAAGAIGGLMIK